MIINGGSRSNGAFFASHLMRVDHNERVELRDIRGLLAGNVADALREMEDVASGTQCKNWFYHADINTREDEHLTPEQWAISDFDALMLDTRRQAALLYPVAEPDEREAPPIKPESAPEVARSAFDEGMAATKCRAERLAAADAALPEDERRQGSWEAWKANMRQHLSNLRGKLLEWWREYFGFEQPASPQREVER